MEFVTELDKAELEAEEKLEAVKESPSTPSTPHPLPASKLEAATELDKTEEAQEELEAVKERPSPPSTPHPVLASTLEDATELPRTPSTPRVKAATEFPRTPSAPLPVHFPTPTRSTPSPRTDRSLSTPSSPRTVRPPSTPSSPRTVRIYAPIPTPLPSPYIYRMDAAMTTPVVDVLVLTFNCGKAIADSNVLARHLRYAFARDAMAMKKETEEHNYLPDVVVL